MKHLTTMALVLNLGVVSVYAQQHPVKMTFSGTMGGSTVTLQPDTANDELDVAGNGTLGPFTFREVHADPTSPQPSSICSPGPYFPTAAGAGVLRFEDGSLLTLTVTEGAYCLDLVHRVGHFTVKYQITGGTGRLKGASGALTLTATTTPVLFTASGKPAILTSTGELEGTVSGVAEDQGSQDGQQ